MKRTQVAANQRTDRLDHNRASQYAAENLHLALQTCFAPSNGWLQRGTMDYVGPGMECFLRTPVAVITASGLALLTADEAITPDGGGGNPRIDLVSVGYEEVDSDQESRRFINPSTKAKFDQNTYTTKTLQATVTLTKGTEAASPSAPATPAGEVALWEIDVPAGATTLSASSFRSVASGAAFGKLGEARLKTATFAGSASPIALPYTSGTLISVETPAGMTSFIRAAFTLIANGAAGTGVVRMIRGMTVRLEDVAAGTIIGRADVQPFSQGAQGARLDVVVSGHVAGPTNGARNYRLNIVQDVASVGDAVQSLVLPQKYADDATAAYPVTAITLPTG